MIDKMSFDLEKFNKKDKNQSSLVDVLPSNLIKN